MISRNLVHANIINIVDFMHSAATKPRTTKSLFRRRYGGHTTTLTTVEKNPKVSEARHIGNDQELEPSSVDKKFVSTRLNSNTDFISDDIAEVITAISKAPLPFSGQSTTLHSLKKSTKPFVKLYTDEEIYPITRRSDTLSTSTSKAQ